LVDSRHEFSRTVRSGKIWRASGTSPMPNCAIMIRRQLAHFPATEADRAGARAGVKPMIERMVVVGPCRADHQRNHFAVL